MSFKRFIQILACLLIATTALSASAKEMTDKQRAQARALYDKAADAYDHGNYQDALNGWLEAYDLSENSLLLYSIANAYERLGKLEETIDALEGYKPHARADEKEVIEMRLINLEERFKSQQETERLREEARERERADARAREAQLREEQGRLADELLESQLADIRRDPVGLRATRGLFVALAGAGVVVGASYQIADRAVRNNLERDCQKMDGGSGYLCISDRHDDLDKHHMNQKVALYSYAAAGVLGVTGLALYFVHPNKDKTLADMAVEPVFYGDGAGARFTLSF